MDKKLAKSTIGSPVVKKGNYSSTNPKIKPKSQPKKKPNNNRKSGEKKPEKNSTGSQLRMRNRISEVIDSNTYELFNTGNSLARDNLFWQKIIITFYIFSIAGHYLELLWAPIKSWLSGDPKFVPEMFYTLPLAAPYGLGMLGIVLIIRPLIKKYDLHPVGTFFLSVFVSAVIEYLSGMFLILVFGRNQYWDYSGRNFNLQGQICLENCLLFGLICLLVVYYLVPWCEKLIAKFSAKTINTTAIVLGIALLVDTFYSMGRYLGW